MGQKLFEFLKPIEYCIILISLILVFQTQSIASPGWFERLKRIEVLQTKRSEVEVIFSNPKILHTHIGKNSRETTYQLPVGRLVVTYSIGKCTPEKTYGYDVGADVVTEVYLTLKKAYPVSKLGIDLTNFNRSEISDMKGVFAYGNSDKGEYFIIYENYDDQQKRISDLKFFPSKEDEKLACVPQ